ncbi:hypothetical protein GX48_06044 [Paracoccidioides brasiliensis]|nr:hypothetical protein GX48_06044 [Paracoccidioides brasiliensis]
MNWRFTLKESTPSDFKRPMEPPIPTVMRTPPNQCHIDPLNMVQFDNHYLRFDAEKARCICERGDKCCITSPKGVEDDISLMYEKPDGQFYLLAGAIFLAAFWRLSHKFSLPPLRNPHNWLRPPIPNKARKGHDGFLPAPKTSNSVLRNNYFFQVDDGLAWSRSIGDEDDPDVSWSMARKDAVIEHHWFRSEKQFLRRLPKTGAVVFTIRTCNFEPVVEIAREPGVPGRLASAARSWGDDVAKYKGRERYGDVLLEYLDGKRKEQVEKGIVRTREEEEAAQKYPL